MSARVEIINRTASLNIIRAGEKRPCASCQVSMYGDKLWFYSVIGRDFYTHIEQIVLTMVADFNARVISGYVESEYVPVLQRLLRRKLPSAWAEVGPSVGDVMEGHTVMWVDVYVRSE